MCKRGKWIHNLSFCLAHPENIIYSHFSFRAGESAPISIASQDKASMASLASVAFPAVASLASSTTLSIRRSSGSSLQVSSVGASPVRFAPRRLCVVAMASPSADINEILSKSIKDAEELCVADNASGECAAAWDEVEEISAEIAHKRVKQSEKKDPLEEFCKDSPEADECRVYED